MSRTYVCFLRQLEFWLLSGFLCLSVSTAWSRPAKPTPPTQKFFIRTWQSAEGLPESSINAVVQTRDGYLWLATYSGLVRFDGVRFTLFNSDNTPELPSSRITSLYEDSRGTLWIGNENGQLSSFSAGRFAAVQFHTVASGGRIAWMEEDNAGNLWVASERGLLTRASDGRVLTPNPSGVVDASTVNHARDRQGRVWTAHGGSVATLENDRLVPRVFAGSRTNLYIECLAASRDGGLWLLTGGRVWKWRGTGSLEEVGPHPWGDDGISSTMETTQGLLAVGTLESGVFLMNTNGESVHLNRADGLSDDWVRCLAEDNEGNLWIGTRNGLNALRTGKVAVVVAPDHWQDHVVLSVAAGPDGSLWVGTEGAGLYRWLNGGWTNFGAAQGLSNPFIWALTADPSGRIWAGTWERGLFGQLGDHFSPAPGMEDFYSPITALASGRGDELWLGTGVGLCKYSAGTTTWFGRQAGPTPANVRAVLRSRDGTIWFGMLGGGLGCLRDDRVRFFGKKDGLCSDFVQCLHEDDAGALWIGTPGNGLNRMKQGKFACVGPREGLPDGFICHIEDDGNGYFWISSHAGIFRVSKADLNRCTDGDCRQVSCLTYGLGDGLPTLECSGGLQSAGCKTEDGRIWFTTIKGLVVLDPSEVKTNNRPPPVLLEEMLAAPHLQFTLPAAGTLKLPPGTHQIEFHYTGLSFVVPEKVRFKYRLEGLDADWQDGGTRRTANYNYLPPGRYTFRVTAGNADGVWNQTGASVAFSVEPYFWQTLWFNVLAVLAGLTCAGGTVWWVMQRRMRRNLERLERQRAVEHERARIARDIHDDVGASLTRITMLSQSVRQKLTTPADVASNLERIYVTARQLTLAMDEIVWAVNPHHDTLDSLVDYLARFVDDFLNPTGISCQLDLPLQVPPWPLAAEIRHNLFLAFKEALHNTVKHSRATEVRIALEVSNNSLRLEVNDNGQGFVSETMTDANPVNRPAPGNGLPNMRRRLKEIGGQFTLQSIPGHGTRVTFVVPLGSSVSGNATNLPMAKSDDSL